MNVARRVWLVALCLLALTSTLKTGAAVDDEGLHAAIEAANRAGGGRVTLGGDILLSAELPRVTSILIIDGGGFTISGAGRFRIFDIEGGGLTLANLTLSAGTAPAGERGGAVRLS